MGSEMGLDRDLLHRVRGLSEHDLRRLMIYAGEILSAREGGPHGHAPPARVRYRQQRIRCGRESCRACPHGPYWYAYWREGGRMRSRYVGKEMPQGPLPG